MAHCGTATLKSLAKPTLPISLRSGQEYTIPAGEWHIKTGAVCEVEFFDPVIQSWRTFGTPLLSDSQYIASDGQSYRLFNPTGCVLGAIITNGGTANLAKNGFWPAGSSSTTGVIATVPAALSDPFGQAQLNCLVGGAISGSATTQLLTITPVTGGTGYVVPPLVTFDPPPMGGLYPTGYAVLTAGAVSSIVITNQGALYPTGFPPKVYINADAGDPGSGATAVCYIDATTNGKLVAITVPDVLLSGGYNTVPAITIGGLAGSPAATAVMCLAVTTAPTVSAASGGANGYQLELVAGLTAGTNITTNPAYTTGVVGIRNAVCAYGTSATFATQVLIDPGLSQVDASNRGVFKIASTGTVPAATTFASGVSGGVNDLNFITPL